MLIANVAGGVADAVFARRPPASTPVAWLGVVAYTLPDLLRLLRLLGHGDRPGPDVRVRFLENFDRPYISRSITEFWRRWHISLSTWFRDYLYIPLGGNRRGPRRGYANLLIVFLLSGLWHGAAWTFVVWGAYQGLFLSLDRLFWGRVAARLPRFVTIPVNFLLLNIGWAFFRAADLESAVAFLARLVVPGVPDTATRPC